MSYPYDRDVFEKMEEWFKARRVPLTLNSIRTLAYGGAGLLFAGLLLDWPWMWGPGIVLMLAAMIWTANL